MSQGEGGGRPEVYKPSFCKIAKSMAKLGATEREIAEALDVSERTLATWKHTKPKFLQSLKLGKKPADDRTERSLYARANGYRFDSEEIVPYDHIETKVIKDEDGTTESVIIKEKRVLRVPIVKHVPPDPTSAIFWLKNRRKDRWRDFKATEISTPPGRPFEIVPAVPAEPELIGAYYRRLAALTAGESADPAPDRGVDENGSESQEPSSSSESDQV